MKAIDLIGQRFGRLTVLGRAENNKHGKAQWTCECDCGSLKRVCGRNLMGGDTRSCGCARVRHGHGRRDRRGRKTQEYDTWMGMKARCYNQRHENFRNYGGRGIKVLYSSFEEFLADVGPKPTPQHSIDRIDVSGHYEKGNCRWSTPKEQAANKRPRQTSLAQEAVVL
jgi:hypothetical protein